MIRNLCQGLPNLCLNLYCFLLSIVIFLTKKRYRPECLTEKCAGVFRTLSNVQDGAFREVNWQIKVVNYFRKTLHLRYLTGFWMHLWNVAKYFRLRLNYCFCFQTLVLSALSLSSSRIRGLNWYRKMMMGFQFTTATGIV